MKWGQWVRTRALGVGIDTKKEMARLCDVSPHVVASWYELEFPERLRDTSIIAIAKALNTHPQIIKSDFWRYEPMKAPSYDEFDLDLLRGGAFDEFLRLARKSGYKELESHLVDTLRRDRIETLIDYVGGEDLKEIYDLCRRLAAASLRDLDSADVGEGQVMSEGREWSKKLEEQERDVRLQIDKRLRRS